MTGNPEALRGFPQAPQKDIVTEFQLVIQHFPHPPQLVIPSLDSANWSVIKSTINIHSNKLTAAGTEVLFGHVRTDAHSAYAFVMPVLPSVRLSACASTARTGRISFGFIWRTFMKICREIRCAVAVGHKYRALDVSTEMVSTLRERTAMLRYTCILFLYRRFSHFIVPVCCAHSSYVWLSLGVVKRQSWIWLSPAAIRWRSVPCCRFVCLRASLRVMTKLAVTMNCM